MPDIDIDILVAAGVSRTAAAALLRNLGTLAGIALATEAELAAAGVPVKTAAKVAAALAIGRRAGERQQRSTVGCPATVWELLRSTAGSPVESFYVLCVDIRNGLIGGPAEVARGSVSEVQVHPREVFRVAVARSAAGIIVAHNHPSGDPTPSGADLELTRRLRGAGEIMGIPVVDHVVVAVGGYRSICEEMGASW